MDFESGECAVVDAMVFDVAGDPAPQGSKKGFVGKKGKAKGKVMMVEVSKKVKPWRRRIALAAEAEARRCGWSRHEDGPVKVVVAFHMKYPQAPKWKRDGRPDRQPDLDKLARSTLDGLSDSKVIFDDDRQVVDLHLIEWYVRPGSDIGARIYVTSLRECAKPKPRRKSE